MDNGNKNESTNYEDTVTFYKSINCKDCTLYVQIKYYRVNSEWNMMVRIILLKCKKYLF